MSWQHPGLEPEGRAQRLRDAYADAVAGLRYIERHYGRLEGCGWDRVFGAFDDLVVIPEREGLPAGFSNGASAAARCTEDSEGRG